MHHPGSFVPREGGRVFPRHCERSEAIHGAASGDMDCFVAEPVIGPRFARTRWLLAMTVRLFDILNMGSHCGTIALRASFSNETPPHNEVPR